MSSDAHRHQRKAEGLLNSATGTFGMSPEESALLLAEAQVHASLGVLAELQAISHDLRDMNRRAGSVARA